MKEKIVVEVEKLGYTIATCAIAGCEEKKGLERFGDTYLCHKHMQEVLQDLEDKALLFLNGY